MGRRPLTTEERLDRAMRFIQKNYRRAALGNVAAAARMSAFHLQRIFKARFGMSPKEMASIVQIGEAQRRMLAGETLEEVARACGFRTHSHFTARFHQLTGETPSHWLKHHREGIAA